MSHPHASDEAARLEALHACGVIDSLPEAQYDGIARLAASICGTPIALVSLVDCDRQWFKAKTGMTISEENRPPGKASITASLLWAPKVPPPSAVRSGDDGEPAVLPTDPAVRLRGTGSET